VFEFFDNHKGSKLTGKKREGAMDRAKLKKRLEQEILTEVQSFSDWKQQEGVYTFAEMEAKALEIAQAMAQALLSYGVADEQQVERQQRPKLEPSCPECGRPMRYGGRPGKKIGSKAGAIAFKRDYYHCPACRAGLFPPGPAAESGGGEVE
jgi:hypothetical protein